MNQPISLLWEGLSLLPEGFQQGLRGFLEEYLSAPFGGRQETLIQAESWLASDEHPFALLVAQAGRGKSAILVHWASELLSSQRADVILLPISLRFGTALQSAALQIVSTKLRRLAQQKVDAPVYTEALSTEIQTMLSQDRERPLVVLIDGADEAIDWQLTQSSFLPKTPGKNVKILVSARALSHRNEDAWQKTLGWDSTQTLSISLPLLDEPAIQDLLPNEKRALAKELLRISEGEPLTLRLCLTHWEAEGSATLSHLTPGLSGYFDRWWQEQRALWREAAPQQEAVTQALLRLLSCALGPLSFLDLQRLLPDDKASRLPQVLQSVSRFVIGDGLSQGYVFSHPKLNEYFASGLSEAERAQQEEGFLQYGKETLEKLRQQKLSPKEVPRYLVRYYGVHLSLASKTDALFSLVSPEWQEAWTQLEGSFEGFLRDVERASKAARSEEATTQEKRALLIPLLMRATLVQLSLRGRADRVPVPLLTAMLEAGLFTPEVALSWALYKKENLFEALAALAPLLPPSLLKRAFHAATTPNEWFEERFYRVLLLRMLSLGEREEALSSLAKLPKESRLSLLVSALPSLPGAQREALLPEALASVRAVEDTPKRAELLLQLSPLLGEGRSSLWAEADFLCREIKQQRGAVPDKLLSLFAKAGCPEKAVEYAVSSAQTEQRVKILAESARFAQHPEEIAKLGFQALEQHLDGYKKKRERMGCLPALCQLFLVSPKEGRALLDKRLSKEESARVLVELARSFALRYLPEAMRALQLVSAPHRICGLSLLLKVMEEEHRAEYANEVLAGLAPLQEKVVPAGWSWACYLWGRHQWGGVVYFSEAEARIEATRYLPPEARNEALQKTFQATQAFDDRGAQTDAFFSLLALLEETALEKQDKKIQKRADLCARVLAHLKNPDEEAHYFASLAKNVAFPPEERRAAAVSLLEVFPRTNNTPKKRLYGAFPMLSKKERAPFLKEAWSDLEEARSADQRRRALSTLRELAPYLSAEQKEALWRALQSESINDPMATIEMFRLVESLPQEERARAFFVLVQRVLEETHSGASVEMTRLAYQLPESELREAKSRLPATRPDWLWALLEGATASATQSPRELARALSLTLALPSFERYVLLTGLVPSLSRDEQELVVEEYERLLKEDADKTSAHATLIRTLVPLGYGSRLASLFLTHQHTRGMSLLVEQLSEEARAALFSELVARWERGEHPAWEVLSWFYKATESLPHEPLYRLLCCASQEVVDHPMSGFASRFYFLLWSAVYVKALGGQEAIRSSFEEVFRVVRWLP